MGSLASSKKELRHHLKSRWHLLASDIPPEWSERLAENLDQVLRGRHGRWAAFRPLPFEPPLPDPRERWSHLEWAFPRMEETGLRFRKATHFVQGPFGVQEPSGDSPAIDVAELNGLLIPGLGYDHRGYRLGRGRGFYDRSLQEARGLRVGVAFEFQRLKELPVEAWDQRMDVVVTERSVYWIRKDR